MILPLAIGEPNITNSEETIDILDADGRVIGHFYTELASKEDVQLICETMNKKMEDIVMGVKR